MTFKEELEKAKADLFETLKGTVIDSHNDAQNIFERGVTWALAESAVVTTLVRKSTQLAILIETEMQSVTVPGLNAAVGDFNAALRSLKK